jgi:hypothetical protein
VEAEKRLVQLQHELSMLRLEKTRVDDELSATKAKTVTLAARDKAAHEAERLAQKHADALEEYRIREERATIEHRTALDRLSAEMAQTQNNLADSQVHSVWQSNFIMFSWLMKLYVVDRERWPLNNANSMPVRHDAPLRINNCLH